MKFKHLRLFSLLLIVSFWGQKVQAQTLQFAKVFTETGEGVDKRNVWYADSAEQRVAILYVNGKQTIQLHRLTAEIKMPNDSLVKLVLKVGSNKNWVAEYFTMTEIGKYEVTVKDDKGNNLAVNTLFLRGQESFRTDNEPVQISNAVMTLKYEKCVLTFCESFKNGEFIHPGSNFKWTEKGKYIEIVLQSDTPIETDKIVMDVWKKKEGESVYSDHVDSKEVKVDRTKNTNVFHYSFRKQGDYKISLFTKDIVWITSGYVSISQ